MGTGENVEEGNRMGEEGIGIDENPISCLDMVSKSKKCHRHRG